MSPPRKSAQADFRFATNAGPIYPSQSGARERPPPAAPAHPGAWAPRQTRQCTCASPSLASRGVARVMISPQTVRDRRRPPPRMPVRHPDEHRQWREEVVGHPATVALRPAMTPPSALLTRRSCPGGGHTAGVREARTAPAQARVCQGRSKVDPLAPSKTDPLVGVAGVGRAGEPVARRAPGPA